MNAEVMQTMNENSYCDYCGGHQKEHSFEKLHEHAKLAKENKPMNHTPTPWKISNQINWGLLIGDYFITFKGDNSAQQYANAKFAETACNAHEDLVKACKAALRGDGDYFQRCKDAIAKAEGKD